MVWMRTAGLPNFRKLWGRINGDLIPGKYTLVINNNYDVEDFDAQKYFVITTSNGIGGKNYFLGIVSISLGGLCLVAALAFFILHRRKQEQRN